MFPLSASREERPKQSGNEQPRAGEELIRRVFVDLPLSVALFEATRGDFRCLAATAAFTRKLGLGRGMAAGVLLGDLIDPNRKDRKRQENALEAFSEVCASGEPGSIVLGLDAGGGAEERPTVSTFQLLPVKGVSRRVTHIVMLSTDGAAPSKDQQAFEAARLRERAEHLEELERAKSEFLNLASHELRGPAATLRGYLSMLEEGTLGPLPDALREVLPVLQAKASQINVLASEMIEAARLEDRGLSLNRERVDMRRLLARLVANCQATAPNHRLLIQDRSLDPPVVSGDPLRLQIVIDNLLDNAVKYSPGGGEIYCDLTSANGMLVLTVRDTGIGIAAEDMPRLFVRFSRLATEAMPDVPGTGLGLYLARELARLHGGDIVAVSGPGQGSEFTLTLPLDAPAAS